MKKLHFLPLSVLLSSLSGCISGETPPDENEVESLDETVDASKDPQGSSFRTYLPPIEIDWTKLPRIPKPTRCKPVIFKEDAWLIDDFEEGGSPNGSWLHEAGGPVQPGENVTATDPFSDVTFLDFECSTELWCNREWEVTEPWDQWASVTWTPSSGAVGKTCLDAQTFQGIRFRARSANGADRVFLMLNTPDSIPETFEGYNSEEKELKSDWSLMKIPFEDFQKPHWSSIPSVLSRGEITSIVFVARTVQPMNDEGQAASLDDAIVGEKLLPYDIEIDWVELY